MLRRKIQNLVLLCDCLDSLPGCKPAVLDPIQWSWPLESHWNYTYNINRIYVHNGEGKTYSVRRGRDH